LLLELHNGTGVDVHIEFGRNNVLRIVIPNGCLMHMDGLDRLAGIADEEPHAEHVPCESVVTSGRAELVVEGLEVPGAALDTVRQTDPGVLRIGSGPEEPQRFILLLVVSKERKELVGHVDRVYVFQRIIAEDIGICIDDNRIRGHLLVGVLQQIGIGEPFSNDLLLDFVGVFTAAPFISEILFVQQNDLVDQWIRQIVLEALTNLLLALCHTVYKILGDEPDLRRLCIDITDTDAVGCELFLALWAYCRSRPKYQVIKMEHQGDTADCVHKGSIPRLGYNWKVLREFFKNPDADLQCDPIRPRKLFKGRLLNKEIDLVLLEFFKVCDGHLR